MATLTVRGVDDETRARLRVRAAHHGRSMEAEVREILREAVATPVLDGFGSRVHARFMQLGDLEIELPDRHESPRAAAFDE